MIIKYMALIIIIFYIFFIIYFKLRYPFWSKQPIFYYHDIKNIFYPKGVIETSLPDHTYKVNKNIDYINARRLTNDQIKNINLFLKNNYMIENHERYVPTNNDVMDHLLCRTMPSSVSLYYDNFYHDLIGTMTSVYKTLIKQDIELKVGYVDYLCVDKKHRGKNIAGKMIENHYIRERYKHKTAVYMFKHEGVSRPFVPLTIYNTYFYKLDLFHKIIRTQNDLTNILVNDSSSHLLYDLQNSLKKDIEEKNNHFSFKCVIMDNLEHITYLIKKQHLHVFCLLENKTPLAFYFFKNNYTTYNGDKSIECFSCIKYDHTIDNDKFLFGFYLAIDYLKTIDKYKILLLENISDSHYILQGINQSPYHYSKYYYYMYNYAMKPISAKQIAII